MSSDSRKQNKQKKEARPKLSLVEPLSGGATESETDSVAASAVSASGQVSLSNGQTFSDLEKFQELVKDIVSFEISASKKTAPNTSGTVNLTRARVSALESIRLDTPAQVMRMINNDSDEPEPAKPASPGKKK